MKTDVNKEIGGKKKKSNKIIKIILIAILIFSIIGAFVTSWRGIGDKYDNVGLFFGAYDLDNDGDKDIVFQGPEIMVNKDGKFSNPKEIDVGYDCDFFIIEDMNGDDLPDFIYEGTSKYSLLILWNDKDFRFDRQIEVLNYTEHFYSFRTMDWDLDGNSDIVVYFDDDFMLILNMGNEGFDEPVHFPYNKIISGMDYNQDGVEDIILIEKTNLTVLFRNENGVYNSQNISINPPINWRESYSSKKAIRVLDADSDGDKDILLGTRLLINLDYKEFKLKQLIDREEISFEDPVIIEDLNNDGRVDILYYDPSGVVHSHDDRIYLKFSDENFNFSARKSYRIGAWGKVYVMDIDKDNDNDIISINFHADSVTVRYNDGSGGFKKRIDFPVRGFRLRDLLNPDDHVTPTDGTFIDIDHDDDIDIITCNYNGGTVSVLKNDGKGHFDNYEEYHVTDFPLIMLKAVDDLDGDGYEDMIIYFDGISFDQDFEMIILYNDGSGNFHDTYHYLKLLFYSIIIVIIIISIIWKLLILRKIRLKTKEAAGLEISVINSPGFQKQMMFPLILILVLIIILSFLYWYPNKNEFSEPNFGILMMIIFLLFCLAFVIIEFKPRNTIVYENGISPYQLRIKSLFVRKTKFYHYTDIEKIEHSTDDSIPLVKVIYVTLHLKNGVEDSFPIKDMDDLKLIEDTLNNYKTHKAKK